ncbi:hypothetical protein Goshw_026956, partial [Gossypium schwendimanii]|nr:hypothetical protein [Gossypium harknessii]MBA0854168.1 hypothetical protein [Gossypium schwendimanii]
MVITARFCTTSSPRIERVWLWRQRWWWECGPNAKTRIC